MPKDAAMPLVPGHDDDATLNSILHNMRIALAGAKLGQQLTGLLGPRPGYPDSDGVPFDAQSCETVFRHLRRHGVLCVRVQVGGHPSATGYSIVAANTRAGLDAMLARARTVVRREAMTRRGLRLAVLDEVPDEAADPGAPGNATRH